MKIKVTDCPGYEDFEGVANSRWRDWPVVPVVFEVNGEEDWVPIPAQYIEEI